MHLWEGTGNVFRADEPSALPYASVSKFKPVGLNIGTNGRVNRCHRVIESIMFKAMDAAYKRCLRVKAAVYLRKKSESTRSTKRRDRGLCRSSRTMMLWEFLHHPGGQRMQLDITRWLLRDGINTEGKVRPMGRFASRGARCLPSVA